MELIRIRCAKCRTVLKTISEVPQDWSGSFRFNRCFKCEMPDPGRIADFLIHSGREAMAVEGVIPWEAMRGPIRDALARGRTVDYPVRVSDGENPGNLLT